MKSELTLDAYQGMVGQYISRSDWILIDQARIDAFADITDDHQYIHLDPVAAGATPFGGTVAHGFLVLSMLSAMAAAATPSVEGATMVINYGMNNLRFIRPVRAGTRIRTRFDLKDFSEKARGQWQANFAVTVEIEGDDKPTLVTEWLLLYFVDPN